MTGTNKPVYSASVMLLIALMLFSLGVKAFAADYTFSDTTVASYDGAFNAYDATVYMTTSSPQISARSSSSGIGSAAGSYWRVSDSGKCYDSNGVQRGTGIVYWDLASAIEDGETVTTYKSSGGGTAYEMDVDDAFSLTWSGIAKSLSGETLDVRLTCSSAKILWAGDTDTAEKKKCAVLMNSSGTGTLQMSAYSTQSGSKDYCFGAELKLTVTFYYTGTSTVYDGTTLFYGNDIDQADSLEAYRLYEADGMTTGGAAASYSSLASYYMNAKGRTLLSNSAYQEKIKLTGGLSSNTLYRQEESVLTITDSWIHNGESASDYENEISDEMTDGDSTGTGTADTGYTDFYAKVSTSGYSFTWRGSLCSTRLFQGSSVSGVKLPAVTKTDDSGKTIKSSETVFKVEYYPMNGDGSYASAAAQTLYYQTSANGKAYLNNTDYLTSSSGSTYYTNSSGKIVFYAGKVIITEETAPAGYDKSTSSVVICIGLDTDVGDDLVLDVLSWEDADDFVYTADGITCQDAEQSPSLTLVKSGSSAAQSVNAVQSSSDYSLAGAVYRVYTDSACTSAAAATDGSEAVLTTDASGTSNTIHLASGKYYIKEITPSEGYRLSSAKTTVTLSAGDEETIYVTEEIDDAVTLKMVKTDETGTRVKSGDVRFTVQYYYRTASGYTLDKTAYYKTNASGLVNFANVSCLDSSKTSGYYTNSSGNIVWYAGRLVITETAAADGYLISEEAVTIDLDTDASGELYVSSVSGDLGYDSSNDWYTFVNEAVPPTLTLKKETAASYAVTPVASGYEYDLAGAVYYVYTDADCTVQYLDDSGNPVVLTTDSSGMTNTVDLEVGTFYIKEVTASPGYLVTNSCGNYAAAVTYTSGNTDKTLTVYETPDTTAPELTFYKTDAAGNVIAQAGTVFKAVYYYQNESGAYVKNKTLYFQTDADGKTDFGDKDFLYDGSPYTNNDGDIVYFAGKLVITEYIAPDDFAVSDQEITLILSIDEDGYLYVKSNDNDSAYGAYMIQDIWQPDVSFCKINSATGEAVGIGGFTFRLHGTSDDGETVNLYAAIDGDSVVTFEDVPVGTYTLTETVCPESYVPDDTEWTVVVDGESMTITIDGEDDTDGSFCLENVSYLTFSIYKLSTGGDVVNTVYFTLYSDGLTDAGNYYEKTVYTGSVSSGIAAFDHIEPGHYYLLETDVSEANPAVAESDAIWELTVTRDGKITLEDETIETGGTFILEYEDDKTYTIYNTRLAGFSLRKVSTSDSTVTISGVIFHLYSASLGVDTYASTDEEGVVTFENLLPGEYVLIESDVSGSDPAAVADYSTKHTIVIGKDASVAFDGELLDDGEYAVVENDVYQSLTIAKYDSYHYSTVAGLVFNLKGQSAETADYDETLTTDENGRVTFEYLLPGTYKLTETDASGSYLTSDDEQEMPAVILDGRTHVVVVSEDGTVYVDDVATNASHYYTFIDETVRSTVIVYKKWVTDSMEDLYLSDSYTLDNAAELPILHIVTEDTSDRETSGE